MTPVEYINWVRIRAACKELRKTNISVNEIAMRSGFTTISTFNRNFRRILGVSPQQWRSAPEHYERKLLNFDIKTQEDGDVRQNAYKWLKMHSIELKMRTNDGKICYTLYMLRE